MTTFTYRVEFTRSTLSKLNTFSAQEEYHGLLWKLCASIDQPDHLASYLYCESPEVLDSWSCKVDYSISLLSPDTAVSPHITKFKADRNYNGPKEDNWGWGQLATIVQLDSFVRDDKFAISAEVTVKEANFGNPIVLPSGVGSTYLIQEKFQRNTLSSTNVFSRSQLFHGFLWKLCVRSEGTDKLAVFLYCDSLESYDTWNCCIDYSISIQSPYKKLENKKADATNREFKQDSSNWGWKEFTPLENLDKFVKSNSFTVAAEIKIKSCEFGEPKMQTVGTTVDKCIPLSALTADKNLTISQTSPPRPWIAYIKRSTDSGYLTCRVKPLGEDQSEKASVTVSVTCRDSDQGVQKSQGSMEMGVENSDILIHGMTDKILVSIRVSEPSMLDLAENHNETEEPKETPEEAPEPVEAPPARINFGRETISIPEHGNFTLILADGSHAQLNSYILSYNSPVLRRLIVKDIFTEHDVSDFDAAAVGIFIDACYTGTLEKLTEAIKFSVFSDLVKMFAVFQVEWPLNDCYKFFKKAPESQFGAFRGFKQCCDLAVSMSTKHANHRYLSYVVAGIDKAKWNRFLPRFLSTTFIKSHMDLIMVLTVETGLVPEFIPLLINLASNEQLSDKLLYILRNFNFDLCDKKTVEEFCQDLEEMIEIPADESSHMLYELTKTILKRGDSEGDQGATAENSTSGDEVVEFDEDGTLATIARRDWAGNEMSKWPCTNERPFSSRQR